MKRTFKDHLNRSIKVNFPPKRIICLVPSLTELLYDLGLDSEIVGITRFCIHPKSKFKEKTKIGGTKKFNFDKIRALKPDLIITNKEENYKEGIEVLEKEFPVWVSDIFTLEDSLKTIIDIGILCNKIQEAESVVSKITNNFDSLKTPSEIKKVAYIIWQNPIMSVNNNTFINDILQKTSFENVFKNKTDRYPEISEKDLLESNADYIFLSSEPYPFKEKHLLEFQTKFPYSKIILVDGEIFSWYGSRLLKVKKYIRVLKAFL